MYVCFGAPSEGQAVKISSVIVPWSLVLTCLQYVVLQICALAMLLSVILHSLMMSEVSFI